MFKKLVKKLIWGYKADSKSYIEYHRRLGCSIGNGVVIYSPKTTHIDVTRPWLIKIGDYVKITHGVTILTHGYDWSVIKGFYGDVLGSSGMVDIGNNVFIGMNATILKGVHIGNNVIIGAGSIVTSDIPDNFVAAGNPCKCIMSLDEYYNKRLIAQEKEAVELVKCYRERYGKNPTKSDMAEFFWLFSDGNSLLDEKWVNHMKLNGTEELSYSRLNKNKKKYENMENFFDLNCNKKLHTFSKKVEQAA